MRTTRKWADRAVLAAAALAALAAVVPAMHAQECSPYEWQKMDEVFDAMGVREGAVVADVGAGHGLWTTGLAAGVGRTGRVYAVDVSDSALERLRRRLAENDPGNVTVIKGEPDDPRLPAGVLDAALIVNAYHEMQEHQAMLAAIRRALKPDGRLVIVEPISDRRRGQPRAEQVRAHEIAPEHLVAEARAAGFRISGLQDPFATRGNHLRWLAVLQPDPARSASTTAADPAATLPPFDLDDPALRVTLDELKAQARAGRVTILDVRDSRSFERAHIAGARFVSMTDLPDSAGALRALESPIVTYCSCPAEETSARAALILRQHGVADVRALVGGFEVWQAAGLPVDTLRAPAAQSKR